MSVVSEYFLAVCKSTFFALFFAFRFEMHGRCTKLEQIEEIFWGGPMPFECMGICVLSPAHESEIRGYLVYVLIVKYLSHRFCSNSVRVYRLEGLILDFCVWNFGNIFSGVC